MKPPIQVNRARNANGVFNKSNKINSDVVETVTSETETWLKLRDRDFAIKAETWKLETSHFAEGD